MLRSNWETKQYLPGRSIKRAEVSNSRYKSPFKNFNSLNTIRNKPFNHQSSDLSFQGFSFGHIRKLDIAPVERLTEEIGLGAKNKFMQLMSELDGKGFGIDVIEENGKKLLKIEEKSFLSNLVGSIIYPVWGLPKDAVIQIVKGLKKIKPLKDSQYLNAILEWSPLKNHVARRDAGFKKASLAGYLELGNRLKPENLSNSPVIDKLKADKFSNDLFINSHLKLDPKKASYSGVTDRVMSRTDTGLLSATFLAADNYNLTRLCNDSPEDAKKESKKRFKQEVGRLGATVFLTFLIANTFKKFVNNSFKCALGSVLLSTLIAEVVGRALVGTAVLPVSTKSVAGKKEPEKETNAAQKDVPLAFKAFIKGNKIATRKFSGRKEPKENTSGHYNVFAILAGLVLIGAGATKAKAIAGASELISGKLKTISRVYKGLVTKEETISKADYRKIIEKLTSSDVGYDAWAKKYTKDLQAYNGAAFDDAAVDTLKLGVYNKDYIYQFVDKGILFPFRAVGSVVMLPYKGIKKLGELAGLVEKQIKPKKEVKSLSVTRNALKYMQKRIGKSNAEFAEDISSSMLKSLDSTNKTKYSANDLSVYSKFLAPLISGLFLSIDNYNLVMKKTQGEDKRFAVEKAKERACQTITRNLFSTYITKTIQSTFDKIYNATLIGASGLRLACSLIYESTSRKAVGQPFLPSTKEEIIKMEEKNLSKDGFVGSYFRFISKITGKKQLSERLSSTNC